MVRNLKVFAALADDISNGHVWLTDSKLKPRSIVRIRDDETGSIICCEALQFEANFERAYNAGYLRLVVGCVDLNSMIQTRPLRLPETT